MSATQNNLVNKLVFNLTVPLGATIGSCRARAFVVTQVDATTVASDIYGRFMQARPAMPAGSVTGPQRGKNDVQAWFQPVPESNFDIEGNNCSGQPFQVAVDFISHLAPNAYTAPPIDPTTTRLFKLRAYVTKTAATITIDSTNAAFGKIYCQRLHSIEV